MAKERDSGTAYLLWALGFFGFCGMHRFYVDKPVSGIVWLLTGGLCGVGQIVDLFLIPSMVRERNLELGAVAAHQLLQAGVLSGTLPAMPQTQPMPRHTNLSREEQLQVELSRLASTRGGSITVNQGVVATGRPPKEVQAVLDEMVEEGYVSMDIDDDGTILYSFKA